MDEGLGTTYERIILHAYFQKIREEYQIQSVIEVPCYGMTGMTGINSIWWSLKGAEVTVVDVNEQRSEIIRKLWKEAGKEATIVLARGVQLLEGCGDKCFDMSWNFAALWHGSNLDTLIEEMSRVTRKVIFICVPNRESVGYWFRLSSIKKKGLNQDNIRPRAIRRALKQHNWVLAEEGYFDVPPWPDIAMKKEELFEKIGLNWLAKRYERNETERLCILDYYNGSNKNLEHEMMKYSFLEDLPKFMKRLWAHHRYFIFTKNPID